VVRLLTVTDAAAYFDLRRRAHGTDPHAFAPAVAADPGLSLTRIESALARDPQAAQACIVGAFTRQLVGALGVFREPDARDRAQLWGLYVTPEQRRAGLGLSLLSAACDRARGMNGVERLQLRVAVACPEAIRCSSASASSAPGRAARRTRRAAWTTTSGWCWICLTRPREPPYSGRSDETMRRAER
jgi:GNAT superfamily N-acetyltransferase